MHISEKSLMCLQPKTWNMIGKPPYRLLNFTQECSFQWKKNPFLWLANTFLKPPFFEISRLKLQKLLKSCWPIKTESWLQWVICWRNFVRIATLSEGHLRNMAKSTRKSEFHPCAVPSTWAPVRNGSKAKRELCTPQ